MNRRPYRMPLIIGVLWVILSSAIGTASAQSSAASDTVAAAAADSSAATEPAVMSGIERAMALAQSGQQTLTPRVPLITSWTRSPSASANAALRSVIFSGGFNNTFSFKDGSLMSQTGSLSHESYRTKETTSSKRDGTVTYRSPGKQLLSYDLTLLENWNEEEITNTTGQTTINRRDFKQAQAGIGAQDIVLGGVTHDLDLTGATTNQAGVQQNQRNDFSEASLAGALRSSWEPLEGLRFKTGAFTMTESGERSLGVQTNPSSANGDTLRAGVGYRRGRLIGSVTVKNSNFEKRYLDYRRNANGVIDTIGATEKIVEELESNDAVTFEWSNEVHAGSAVLKVLGSRDISENSYLRSGVGVKERRQDMADVSLSFRLGSADSLRLSYKYLWGWSDQTYQGATIPRGRQVTTSQTVKALWVHQLFADTDLVLNLNNGISQDIAQNMFNQNDRDRIDASANLKLRTLWDNGVSVDLVFDARRVEDISIRSSRSANNSVKDTYEISPQYSWPVARWLDIEQSFRVWIQYTDFLFSDLEAVNKQDDFNKRGNLETSVILHPNQRLRVTMRHNHSITLNGKKISDDVVGNSYYFFESDQRVDKLNVSLAYRVNDWFSLEGTTYSGRDLKESYGDRITVTDRYSGDVGVGCSVDKGFGQGRNLKLSVRKIYAHGPSVRDEGKDYWDADFQLNWGF